MARGERPLDGGDGTLLRFAADLRQLRRQAGNPTYQQLVERAHYSAAALSTAANGRKLPSLAVTLAYVRACDGDVTAWEERWHAVAAELANGAAPADGPDSERSPYVGLAAFQLQDSEWFFGRERQVDDLMTRLSRQRFVAVFGASGVGKSSLLRAGLAARWPAEAANRTVVVFTPGAHPLEECAIQFARLTACAPGQLLADLAADQENLRRTVRQALAGQPDDAEILVVVDQFEEIFTVCRDETERVQFVCSLLTAAQAENARCRVVLGIRADFYAHCTRHPELLDALKDAQVAVGAMTVEELRRAVVEPAKRANCTLEGALLAELIAHADGHDGVLPMLSHALLETWYRRRGNTLTLAGFQAAGGISGALAHTAESVYTSLDPDQQRLVKDLFLRLTALGEGTEDTKRRTNRSELTEGTESVLAVLAGRRLVTLDDSTVEIAHEALIGAWPRLRQWLTADRDALRAHRQLTEAAQAWIELDRDSGALYRGARLTLARDWASGERSELNDTERSFLDASIQLDDAERALATRRARRMRNLVAGLAVLLLAVTAVTVVALQQRGEAIQARQLAVSRQLATQALTLVASKPSTAKLLSVEAYRTAPTFEARSALMSMSAHDGYQTEIVAHTGAVSQVEFAPDGSTFISVGRDKTVAVWDTASRRRIAALTQHDTWLKAMALSSDGQMLATAGDDRNLVLWDLNDRTPVATLPHHSARIRDVVFSPDARFALTTSDDHTVALWDVRQRSHLATLTGHSGPVVGVAWSSDGNTAATASDDGTAVLWDIPSRTRIAVLTGHTGAVSAVGFSPDGRTLATADEDGAVVLWDVSSRTQIATMAGHKAGRVISVRFSPDGRTLATAGVDDTIILWDTTNHILRARLGGGRANIYSVSFSPTGTQLAAAGEDGKIVLWDTARVPLTNSLGGVNDVAFSPDGRTIVAGGANQTVAWDTASRTPRAVHTIAGTMMVNAVAFSPDGRMLAVGSQTAKEPLIPKDNILTLWDYTRPAAPTVLTGHNHALQDLAFSPDGKTAATASSDGTVILWDTTRSTRLATVDVGAIVNGVAFSPDGRTIATATHDPNTVTLLDAATHTKKATFTGHDGWVGTVRFSPDGKTLASASADDTVILWNAATGEQLDRLTGHDDAAFTGLAYSPDGKVLAFTSADHTVVLWDVEHRARLARLTGHTNTVRNLAYSPDGKFLASASDDHTVILWDTDAEHTARQICAAVGRNLAQPEWTQFIPELPYRETCGTL